MNWNKNFLIPVVDREVAALGMHWGVGDSKRTRMTHGMEVDSASRGVPDWLEQEAQRDNVRQSLVVGDILSLRSVQMMGIGVMPELRVAYCTGARGDHHLMNPLLEEGHHNPVVPVVQMVAGSWEGFAVEEGPVVAPVVAPVEEGPVYYLWEGNCKWGVVQGIVVVGQRRKQVGQHWVEGNCAALKHS